MYVLRSKFPLQGGGGMSGRKKGEQPLTLLPRLTHESTLLFYNPFCLSLFVVE